jgi:hypothetical protein
MLTKIKYNNAVQKSLEFLNLKEGIFNNKGKQTHISNISQFSRIGVETCVYIYFLSLNHSSAQIRHIII